MKNKYNARGQKIDGYYFPSAFECRVYHLLRKHDNQLIVHPKMTLIEHTKPWKNITWIPDFYSPFFNRYIEVKGVLTDSFKLKMQLLQYLNPGLVNQCWFVIRGTSYQWQGISFINIDEFQEILNNLEIPRTNNE
ncbi:DUF1064 domain-containing protein [Limnospira platensis CENA597]|uniref:DUF1064 domain-containing protein n=1 Tax=Limnospira platensis TaxID=118562 RepID=UPI003D9FB38C